MADNSDRPTEFEGEDQPTEAEGYAPSDDNGVSTAPGRVIDNYRLIRKVGEGGMGEVWEAEQFEPVRRTVAFKVIKRGMDSEQVVTRFAAEQQALAMMVHPSIARAYDAGTTPGGRPYFVMEHVPGVPLTTYCDRKGMDTPDRLELFIQICEGVQHAHQKAIIHRDLKPSNVLIMEEEGKPLPKIIDFGVAKAMDQRLTDKTMYTEMGQLIGTPEYMSPEQTDFSSEGIDTRSDVYALGVMLYELLVGTLPFESEELRAAGFDGIRKKIREVDPPKPSTRVTSLGMDTGTFTSRHHVPRSTLTRELKGDLDWIVMKALEKDRTRRYGTALELAADIRRHLNFEPVLAGPPSKLYRTRKFVRRHRIGVTSAATLVLLLVAFAITMAVQADRIARERDRANQEAETSKQVSDFMVGLFEVSDPSESLGNTITAREILDEGATRIQQELADQPIVMGRMMNTMGKVYRSLGLYDDAGPLLEQSLATLRANLGDRNLQVASVLENLGTLRLKAGKLKEAEPLFQETLSIREELLGQEHRDVASAVNNLGNLAYKSGNYEAAKTQYQRARDLFEAVGGPDHPDVARSLNNLAIVNWRTKDVDQALVLYQQALQIQEKAYGTDHPDVAGTLNSLAALYRVRKEYVQARALYERCLLIRRKVLGPAHPRVAETLNNLGNLLMATEDFSEAKAMHEQALVIRRAALGSNHADVGQSLNNLGIVLKSMGDYTGAREYYEQALKIQENALGPTHRRVALGYYNLAGVVALQGERQEALDLVRQAVERGFVNKAIYDDSDFRSLRGDPGFEAEVDKVRQRLEPAK
ncbi:MAG: serine/threonine protein kinase [Acidobacteria bacterium]|uniref:Serine/threonine protein kinase n=1 Tax=Candidatus Polarisedimenticola svalbardensis TaxID=2886004 RepID=A0A8J7CMD0_9BACT|nr:serine/threonine protein kinase [Candidatus Polarisedimenticola svalbardensis]